MSELKTLKDFERVIRMEKILIRLKERRRK